MSQKGILHRYGVSALAVTVSALVLTFAIKSFIEPGNLMAGGVAGLSILLNKISVFAGFEIPIAVFLLCLNLPLALLCYRAIAPKFTIFSLIQIGLTSLFLTIIPFKPLFDDVLLNTVFGGILYGISTVIALKGNASTGGTDFVALYISSKLNRSSWSVIFIINTIMMLVFGYLFGWTLTGYSIIHQFIITRTTDTFHKRYKQLTLIVTTEKADEIIEAYIKEYRHGISKVDAIGGYSKEKKHILHTVVSAYEASDIIRLMQAIDSNAIINMLKTEQFYGSFYQQPLD